MLYFFYGETTFGTLIHEFSGSLECADRLRRKEEYTEIFENIRRSEFDTMKKKFPNVTIDQIFVVIKNFQPL